MKLIPCSTCGWMVSVQAKACPRCGAPVRVQSGGGGCLLVLVVAGVLVWWGASIGDKKPSAPTSQPAPAPTVTQADVNAKHETYSSVLKLNKVDIITNVRVRYDDGTWTAILTVKDIWHLRHKQLRLQDAQNLWQAWMTLVSPNDPDRASIKLVDRNGNEVGGSKEFVGSAIWVQD